MITRSMRGEEKLTPSESANLDQFCRAVRQVAAGKSQAAQKKTVEAGLAGIAALCHRLFSEGGGAGDEGDWRVRQEVEPLLRQTRLNLTAAAGTLWLYLDRQAQPWAGVWFEPKAEAMGFNLEAAASGCQFCLLQGMVQKELVLGCTAEELGWTTSPDPGTADDWAGLPGQPDDASPAWLFESETPAPPSAALADAGDSTPPAQPSEISFPPPPPISPAGSGALEPSTAPSAGVICAHCGATIKVGKKFCGKCGTPVAPKSHQQR